MLPPRHRLRASSDFAATLKGGRAARTGTRLIVVHANTTDARAGQPPRVGFVVSKALGGAVVRNRTRRRLRALMADRLSGIPAGTDVVVRANPPAATAAVTVLAADLDRALERVLVKVGGQST